MNAHLGIDIGSVSTKGVVIDSSNNILASEYLWTEGNPIETTKRLITSLNKQLDDSVEIRTIGTTGSARRLIGTMLEADSVKNEITAHAVGTMSKYPDVRTIIEIGGQDSKIIIIENHIVSDYAMNTLCAAGTGAFLSSQAKRLGIKTEDLGDMAIRAKKPAKIAARCTVFAESDMVHKTQMGFSKEDIVAGLCQAVASNYLNNVGKGKRIKSPVVFQGGVSKNKGVVKAFMEEIGCEIHVDLNSHLMGAIGSAIISKGSSRKRVVNSGIIESNFQTKIKECGGCPNNCEVICFYKDNDLVDHWGNRCERGAGVFHAGI